MPRLALFSKYCTFLRVGSSGVVEGVRQAHPVHRLLLMSIHDAGMGDGEDLVDGGNDVVHVMKLIAHRFVRCDAPRPGDGHRVAGAAEMTGHQLGVVKRGVARPRPPRVIHVVGLRCPQGAESAEPVEGGQLLLDRGGNVVLRQQLTDAALLSFRT